MQVRRWCGRVRSGEPEDGQHGQREPARQAYPGLPAAATVEASILLAQRLIAANQERKRAQAVTPPDEGAQAKLAA